MAARNTKRTAWTGVFVLMTVACAAFGAQRFTTYFRILQNNSATELQITAALEKASDAEALESEREALSERIKNERKKLFSSEDMDTYRFGIMINNMLGVNGLEISSTKMVVTQNRTVLEYVLRGSTPGTMDFLREVAESEKLLNIPYLSLSAQEDGTMYTVMRISYAQAD